MSYRKLNQAANVTAQALLAAGDGRAEAVALLFEHGITMSAAVMGTLKAGGWYVPLSAYDPATRLEQIVEDSGARVLLTDTANLELARRIAGPKRTVFNLDALEEIINILADQPEAAHKGSAT
jgi:acyl-CoA synthetase (AMP-forming)/AMP-acid ligase II